jgi:thymidylate kinase
MASPGMRSSHPLPALTLAEAPPAAVESERPAASLLDQLARALDSQGVPYCQWKGHWSAHRWASGYGDVDLLVDHDALPSFRLVVGPLGFKLAHPVGHRQIAGVESYFGYDPNVPRLLHLHVHYRLLLGDYWRPVYRLPIERPLLELAVPGRPFRVASPTYQFAVFVLRMMLRQVGRPMLSARTRWTTGIQIQMASLEACSNKEELGSVLDQHLSPVDLPFFERCVRSLQGEAGRLERALLPWQLHQRLRTHVRRPSAAALAHAAAEKLFPGRAANRASGADMRLAGGGLVVALIGGDGAGKSTCARELSHWLAPAFPTIRAHLGNPPRSLLTLLAGGALKLQHSLERLLSRRSRPGSYIELLRHLCTARDRYHLYARVQRFAVAGGIAICERYPIEQNRMLVGPCIPGLLPKEPGFLRERLRAAEASYYARILRPDVLCVLRLDPELAVIRKPEEPADYVRARGRVIWETDWSSTRAHVVDASQPLEDVMRHLKSIVWSSL